MADVPSSDDAVVASDGSRFGIDGVGGSKHLSASLDDIGSLPDHGDDGARAHILDQSGEEGLG